MEAAVMGRMMLYCRSVLWDLGVPQCAATVGYEDNDACTFMAMAQKPTPRIRHIDIKYHALCQWVEQDLIKLEHIRTNINVADIFTKQLTTVLFRRHCDYLMGRVPPQYSSMYKGVAAAYNKSADKEVRGEDVLRWTAAAAAKLQVRVTRTQIRCWSRITQHWARECMME